MGVIVKETNAEIETAAPMTTPNSRTSDPRSAEDYWQEYSNK
jgi:hypothetical protein